MAQLSPQILKDKGFIYSSPGISGADQWQGMAFWTNKDKFLVLRGNISTASGGTLYLWSTPNIAVNNVEELDMLLQLAK